MEDINLNEIADQKEPVKTDIYIPETLDKYSDTLYQDLMKRRERGGKYGFAGYDWGFNFVKDGKYITSGLNSVLNGINPELYIITGGSTVGKTTFCRQLMDEIVISNNIQERKQGSGGRFLENAYNEQGKPIWKDQPENNIGCIYFSYEQGRTELQIKTLSRFTGVNGISMNKGTTKTEDVKNISIGIENLQKVWKYQVIVEADNMTTVKEIKDISLKAKEIMNVKRLVIFVDYLQIIKAFEQQSDIRGSVEYNISELRRLVRTYPDFSVVAISSVARGKADQTGLEVGKESGLIEYTADVVMNLTFDKEKTKDLNENNSEWTNYYIYLSVVKNRNMGERKVIPFKFARSYQRFEQDINSDLIDYAKWKKEQDDAKEKARPYIKSNK